MERHAAMDMSARAGPLLEHILSPEGKTSISHYFVMNWVVIWRDIAAGLFLAGAFEVRIPKDFRRTFLLSSHPLVARLWSSSCRAARGNRFVRLLSRECRMNLNSFSVSCWAKALRSDPTGAVAGGA